MLSDRNQRNDYGTLPSSSRLSGCEIKNVKTFEDVLRIVGSFGKYQKFLIYRILVPFSILLPIVFLNTIFILSEPDHFCHVPGVENVPPDFMEEWKNWTIPWEKDADGKERLSKCRQYVNLFNRSVISCRNGWDYDRSDYARTIPTDFNWVCDREHYVTQAITTGMVGGAAGTIIFALAGDRFGRKPLFFVCCFILVFFRFLSLLVPQYFVVFLVAHFLTGSTFPIIFQLIFSIAAEIIDEEARAWIYASRLVLWWLGGSCILPLIAWLTRSWFLLGLVTTLPGILAMFVYNYIPESPRWLLTRNRIQETALILETVAKTNGTANKFGRGDLHQILVNVKAYQDCRHGRGGRQGILSLVTTKGIVTYTILLSLVWSINGSLLGVSYGKSNLTGNQFLNFFILSLIDLPVGWVGGILANKMGRRWAGTTLILISSIALGVAAITGFFPDYPSFTILPILISKFCTSTAFLIVTLQAVEIFPTELRTTGNGFVSTIGSTIAVSTPYINFLGKIHTSIPYAVFFVLSLVGVVSASFLPETFKQSLPETVGDTEALGRNATYFSFLPTDYKHGRPERCQRTEKSEIIT